MPALTRLASPRLALPCLTLPGLISCSASYTASRGPLCPYQAAERHQSHQGAPTALDQQRPICLHDRPHDPLCHVARGGFVRRGGSVASSGHRAIGRAATDGIPFDDDGRWRDQVSLLRDFSSVLGSPSLHFTASRWCEQPCQRLSHDHKIPAACSMHDRA